ncbi:HB2L protein, partial [Bucco capensis]|nr:HB2L protein [Bucco capensis]
PPPAGFFQGMNMCECHFLNSTEQVRFLDKYIYNREQLLHFDSDVGIYVGDTPWGDKQAKIWNSDPDLLENERAQVDTYCRNNYMVATPSVTER